MSKKLFKRAGTAAMAAAVVVTGLSFGPAAVAAPASTTPNAETASGRIVGKYVSQNRAAGNSLAYYAVNAFESGSGVTGTPYSDLTAASTAALEFTFPAIGSNGQVKPRNNPGNLCLTVVDTAMRALTCDATDPRQLFQWKTIKNDFVSGTALQSVTTSRSPGFLDSTSMTDQVLAAGDVVPGVQSFKAWFQAVVDSFDVDSRTATISGDAVPNSQVIINDDESVMADADGKWSYDLSGLKLGDNMIHLENWVKPEGSAQYVKQAETDINVKLDVVQLTAAASFSDIATEKATITGDAQPGALVTIRDAAGTVLVTTTAHAITGHFTAPIAAPNKAGVATISVTQTITGEETAPVSVDLDYGKAVQITSPVNNLVHPGGKLDFAGKGQPGATIEVHEDGKLGILGTTTVLANDNWSIKGIDLNGAKRTIVVDQISKGNNKTSGKITLNPEGTVDPGEGDIAAPAVTTPAAGSTVTTSRPTFTGTGQKNATVTIKIGKTPIGTATVGTDGTWTVNLTAGLAVGTNNLTVTQTSGTDVKTINHTVVRTAAAKPFAITSHQDNTSYTAGVNTFRGTAAANATIKAVNQWGTVLGTATADANGDWTFQRNLGPTADYTITFSATANGQTENKVLHLKGTPVQASFAVTSPTNNSQYTAGNVTFKGTAAPGTAITSVNQWGTPIGNAVADSNGNWSFIRALGPTATYDITVTATKGTDVKTAKLHLTPAVQNTPVTITSIKDGDVYTPGMNTLKGKGTPGATVQAINIKNGWNIDMGSATVDSKGDWALPARNWGPTADYSIKVTQTNPDKTTSTATVNISAPVTRKLTVTGYTIGADNGAGVFATFTGTASSFAEITIKSNASDTTYQTVKADAKGNWTATRTWAKDHTYNLSFVQKNPAGVEDTVMYGNWTAE